MPTPLSGVDTERRLSSASLPSRAWVAPFRGLLGVEGLIVALAAWTVGYWVALLFGRGWALALPVALLALAGIVVLCSASTSEPPVETVSGSETGHMLLVLLLVVSWPILYEVGRTRLAVLAICLLALRLVAPRLLRSSRQTASAGGFDRRDVGLATVGGVAMLAMLAFRSSWTIVVLILILVGLLALLKPTWPAPFGASQMSTRINRAPVPSLLLGGFGLLFAVWGIGYVPIWASDNTYYINKAQFFAQHHSDFGVRDFMYGVGGITHVPYGDILTSFEPLVGLVAALTRRPALTALFTIVVPAAIFFVPFAARYAARGLGIARPATAGAVTTAFLILTTATDTTSLFVTSSYGKMLGAVLVAPLLLGALGWFVRQPSRRSVTIAVCAAVAFTGMSPSLAISGSVVVASFTAVALWKAWSGHVGSRSGNQFLGLFACAAPLIFIAGFSLFGSWFQGRAGPSQYATGFKEFTQPQAAWELAFGPDRAHLLTVFFVLGATAVLPLVVAPPAVRRAWGMLLLALFGLLFAPWSFGLLVGDVLDLNRFAWRFFWAIPGSVLVGMVLAGADRRRNLSALTLTAAVIGLGLSGPAVAEPGGFSLRSQAPKVWEAPPVWPWDRSDSPLRRTAEQVIAATPPGGTFLAPSAIEEASTALQTSRHPTYARKPYIDVVAQDPSTPAAFAATARVMLAAGMAGKEASTGDPDEWPNALEAAGVDTACTDAKTAEGLTAALANTYRRSGTAGGCELWIR